MLNHKTLSIMLGMLLLIAGSAAYAALPPRINWTPAQLAPASMAPGTSTSHTVVLKHTGILPIPFTNQLRIVAEGAIVPFVTITQPKFPPVFKRGNQVTVPITVSVPANTPAGKINGTLVLKRILNGKEIEVWRANALPVTITVEQGVVLNKPPVANAGINQTVTVGNNVTLNGTASSDPDGNSLTYTWSFKQVPPGSTVVLSNVTAVNPNFTPDKSGTYVVQLVVNDGTINSDPSEAQITAIMTPEQKIQSLEDQGDIPKLDRSTDIQGPDVNTNSIRDDVEAYIETHYTSPPQRAAIEQLARVVQAAMLVDKTDAATLKAVSLKSSKAVHCLYGRFNVNAGAKHPAAVIEEIESISTNTKARLLAYLEYSKALDGSAGSVPEGDTCE